MKEEKIETVPCEHCPKNVKEGEYFSKDGKTYCCEKCKARGKIDNTCEFC